MTKSSRHHYIPEFFIKNFTDDDGFLYVYNKIENRISNKKRSPKSLFFEMDRNTVDFSGHQLDNLENLYADLDSKISRHVQNVLLTKTVTPEELISITFLACLLKWRVPKSDEMFNIIKEDLTQEDLAIKITVKDEDTKIEEEALRHIESSNIFKETKRIMLGLLPLVNSNKPIEIYNNSFIYTNHFYPSLIGDCPVIEKENFDINKIEDFILPLSSADTFIYKQGCKKEINNVLFFIQRDLAIINSSERYIGCRNKEHLEKVVKIYNQTNAEGNLNNIHKHIFNFIN